MTGEKLFQVDDRFEIEGVGLMLTPGISVDENEIGPGSRVRLQLPDGTSMTVAVAGISTYSPKKPSDPYPIAIRGGYTKADVPVGTEVFKL
ncbi:MAG: hypothetical protein AAGF72_00845 [Pseudomonadota bacterium]